jgi:murein DD-endopeptidase MepM/ murein hydrolase activator NlpD
MSQGSVSFETLPFEGLLNQVNFKWAYAGLTHLLDRRYERSMRVCGVFLTLSLLGCSNTPRLNNPYERASASQRAAFKKVGLPLTASTPFELSQGAFGKNSHHAPGYEYAWDFDVPFGTPIIAVEDGKVIQVWEPEGMGGCDPRFSDLVHNVKVLAHDGTVAQYAHIKSKVRISQNVKKGQVIAETANNRFFCTPQLHFSVFKDRHHLPGNHNAVTIPVLFEGLPGDGLGIKGYQRR